MSRSDASRRVTRASEAPLCPGCHARAKEAGDLCRHCQAYKADLDRTYQDAMSDDHFEPSEW